jgi:hypothetical protein
MRISKLVPWLCVAGLAFGCGHKQPAPHESAIPGTGDHGVGEHHDMEDEHHGVGIAEIDSFHETLGPLWHAEHGDKRKADTCGGLGGMKDQAVQIIGRARADHAGWEGNANALSKAIDDLGVVCGGGAGDFDAAFSSVHDAFHVLMEAAMTGHEGDHAHVGG